MPNFFDIIILLIVIGLGISGFFEGLVRSVVKLGGFLITVAAIAILSDKIVLLSQRIGGLSPAIAVPLTFVVLLVAGTVVFTLLANILHKVIHLTPVGFIDSGLGAAFGVLKALLLGGFLALILSFTPTGSFFNEQYVTSRTGRPLVGLLSEAVPFVRSAVRSWYERTTPPPSKPEIQEQRDHEPSSVI